MLTGKTERIGNTLFQHHRVGALLPHACAAACSFSVLVRAHARHRFDLAHIEIAGDDFLRQRLGVGVTDQHARVPGIELAGV